MAKLSSVKICYTLSDDDEEEGRNGTVSSDELKCDIKEEILSDGEQGEINMGELSDVMDTDEIKEESWEGGLVSVMNKILNKKVTQKTAILAKAKTDKQIALKKKRKAEEEEKEFSSVKKKCENEGTDIELTAYERMMKRKQWENMSRVKPNVLEREKERELQRIATMGVVQLFNAVKQQQKTVEGKLREVGSSVRKQDKVMDELKSGDFVEILKSKAGNPKSMEKTKREVEEVKIEEEEKEEAPSWNILRQDFMMGAKMKDWDQQSDDSDT